MRSPGRPARACRELSRAVGRAASRYIVTDWFTPGADESATRLDIATLYSEPSRDHPQLE